MLWRSPNAALATQCFWDTVCFLQHSFLTHRVSNKIQRNAFHCDVSTITFVGTRYGSFGTHTLTGYPSKNARRQWREIDAQTTGVPWHQHPPEQPAGESCHGLSAFAYKRITTSPTCWSHWTIQEHGIGSIGVFSRCLQNKTHVRVNYM